MDSNLIDIMGISEFSEILFDLSDVEVDVIIDIGLEVNEIG